MIRPPIITLRLDEPYNYPGEDEATLGKDEEFEMSGVLPGARLESAPSAERPAQPAREGTAVPQQLPPFPMRATDWMIAVSMVVLSLAAVYYVVTTNRYYRSQYQSMANSLQASLSAAEESMRSEQRAWVRLQLPTAYPLSREGGGFAIKLQNAGKTPARNVLITDYVAIEDLDQLSGLQEAASHRSIVAGTLTPGDEFDTSVWFKTSPEGISSLAQGKVRAVNYSLITYEDVFHHKHTTQSCFYWHGGMQTPLTCERFNTVE